MPKVPLSAGTRPTALVCATDLHAFGALKAARELGLRVPLDVAVTGFDNLEASALSSPSLTTVKQDCDLIGREAIAALLAEKPGAEPVLVPSSLILRESP